MDGAAEAILHILKKASRDVRRTLSCISIELMFRLLEAFASNRHSFAPTIYKTLTFLLIEFYWEIDVREIMLKHFVHLFENFEAIPIKILCEPLLKQIEISQFHLSSFNVFDFEFFRVVANHPKLNIQTALLLMDSLSKVALTSVIFQQISIEILRTLLQRFSVNQELYEHWKDAFRQMLSTLANMQARFAIHRHHLRQEENNFFNRLALRKNKKQASSEVIDPSGGRMTDQEYTAVVQNEKLMVNLLTKIIHV